MKPLDAQRPNPFPGLRPFRSDEHHLFFGREEQTAALLQLLRTNRFLAVVGTSGSGKSSLVRAGMIAELHGGTMTQAGSTWEVMLLRPGGSPIENLARAFVEADLYDAKDASTLPRLLATLNRSRFGLVEAMKQSEVFEPGTNLLVVVDQFEELFRFRQQGVDSEETAAAFVNLLLTASEQSECPIYIAITMRSDYLGDCSEIPGLAEAVNDGEYLIPRLLRDQKRDAIEKPIGVGGAKISPLLVQRLLNDVGDDPDQLPVLQHALMRMWDVWSAGSDHGRPIEFSDLEATGGLGAALSNHADEIYDSLPDDHHRHVCEKIFKTLTEKGDDNRGIRRPTRLIQLQTIAASDRDTVTTVLEAFRVAGVTFVMPGSEVELRDKTVLDLSHESLMRGWQRLRRWVEEEAQSARIFRRLLDTARLWSDGKAGLFRDPDLQIALSWREQEAPNTEWAELYGGNFDAAIGFLEASNANAQAERQAKETARQRELAQAQELAEAQQLRLDLQQRSARKLRKLIAGLAGVAVVAGIALVAALVANNQANKLRIVASHEAENARQSEDRAKKNAEKAEQSAVEANRLSEAAQLAERAMERTAQQAEADRIVAQRETYRSTVKLAESMLQGNEEARFGVADILWQTQPELRAWEWGYLMAQCPLEEWSLQTDATGLSSAVGTADGRFLVTAGIGGTVALWNLESRQQVWQQATGRVHELAVDPQGRFVAVSTADDALPQFKILELATGNLVHQSNRTGLVECAFSAHGEDLYVLEQGTVRCIATSTWKQRAQAALMGLFAAGHPNYNALFVDEAGKYVGIDNQYASGNDFRFSFFDAHTLASTTQLAPYDEVGRNVGNPSTPILNSAQGELTYSIASSVYRKTIEGERSLLGDLSDYVLYLTVDPVSGTVLSATADGAVQIVDSDGGKHSILHGAPITGLVTLPHGRFVTAGADGLVKCWKLSPSRTLAAKTAPPVFGSASANFVDFTSDGKSLLYRTWDRHSSLYQLDSLGYRRFLYPDRGGYINVFPMISPQTNELIDYSNDGLLFFPQSSRGTDTESTRSIPVSRPFSAAFDDKGRILVVSSEGGNPAVFDLESNKPVPPPNVKGNGPVAINPAGSRAAVQTRERLQVWEVATGRLLNSLEAEHNGDAAIPPDFHPEGELIAVLAHHQNPGLDRLVVWNSSLGKTQTTIESQPGVSFKSCKFSADGHRLYALCSDDKVRVLDWKLGKELIALIGGANVGSIAVSPDGLTLAYAGFNPNLFFAKSLPWEGETPRSSNFYRAVDDLRLYTVRTAQTINESTDRIEFTNHSDKPIRIDYRQVAILGLVKSKKRTLISIAPKETIPLSNFGLGIEFLFIDPESSEQLASFTKSDIAITTEEGPVGIKVVLRSRHPMTQAAAEELQGDIAHRQGRSADAIAHYTRAVRIRTSIVRDNPSKASSQGGLAIVFLKNLAVTPGDKSDDRTALLQQAISFWQELTQNPDSEPATWQHLLRFQLQLVDHQVAIGAAESKPQFVPLLSFWSKQSKEQPANRLFAYGLSEVRRKLPGVYPDGVDQATLDGLMAEDPEMAGIIGDVYAGQQNWAQAVALYSRGIQQDARSLGLFAKRAMAYEQQNNWEAASADWLRAAPGNPEWSRRLVALVQRLTDSGEFALAEAVRAKARVVFEEQLVKEPENSSPAGELADLLLPMGKRILLPTSESEGVAWQFTTTQPPDDWTSEDFEDSAWKEGLGGFGGANSQGIVRRSTWTTNDIWLRRTFEWQPASTEHSLVLRLIHDDDVEVYLNGQQVAKLPGWTPGYIDHLLDAAAVGVLHAGTNTIAVHCRQYSGGQDVDAGLVVMPYGPRRLQQRNTAMKITDPWALLAAAYSLSGDTERSADLLAKKTNPTTIAACLEIGLPIDELLDSLQARNPEQYALLSAGVASAAAESGKTDQARGFYERLLKLQPNNELWRQRLAQLRPGVLAVWNFDASRKEWKLQNCELSLSDGVVGVLTTGDNPHFSMPARMPAGGKALVLRYRTDRAAASQLFWGDASGGFEDSRSVSQPFPAASGQWKEIAIPFFASGELNGLRFSPSRAPGFKIDIDSMVLRELDRAEFLSLVMTPELERLAKQIKAEPSSAAKYAARAEFLAQCGRWRESAQDNGRARELEPTDRIIWFKTANCLLLAGDEEGYRKLCRDMLTQFHGSSDGTIADMVCKVCLLRPQSVELAELPLKTLREAAADRNQGLRPWIVACCALASYRERNYKDAIAWTEKHPDLKAQSGCLALIIRAMAEHELGEIDQAQKTLHQAESMIPTALRTLGTDTYSGLLPVSPADVQHDWLAPEILRREAEERIKPR